MTEYKEIPIGRIRDGRGYSQLCTLDIRLEAKEQGTTLSISGELWNHKHTDITEGGQMQDEIRTALQNYTFSHIDKEPRFTKLTVQYDDLKRLLDIWDRWHLNDLNAGCEHQRKAKWDGIKLDESQPLTQANMAMWKYRKEHPKGLLMEPCPTCGYKYGSAWLFEEIPKDVLDFVKYFITTYFKGQ